MNKMKKIYFLIVITIFSLFGVNCGSCYPDGYCGCRDKYKKYEEKLIDYKGNKISHSEYLNFLKYLKESSYFRDYDINNVIINYIYIIGKNKIIKYIGSCLYHSNVYTKEITRFNSDLVFSDHKGTFVKWVKNEKMIFYMIEFNPFKWYEIIIPEKSVYLITGKYIEDFDNQ